MWLTSCKLCFFLPRSVYSTLHQQTLHFQLSISWPFDSIVERPCVFSSVENCRVPLRVLHKINPLSSAETDKPEARRSATSKPSSEVRRTVHHAS
ncbi:hypothetical protein H4582DRAFT_2013558 [Lactarius indigo]|nr:hypothetical protein H4582DRAFT_2013558 [Lactarius indigo]